MNQDPVKKLMFSSLAKAKLLSPKEEIELSMKCKAAKEAVWLELLAEPRFIPEVISFLYAELPGKILKKIDQEAIEDLMQRAVSVQRSRSGYRISKWQRAKTLASVEISGKDPCLRVGALLFQEIRKGSFGNDEWILRIEKCWKEFVYLRNEFIEKNMRLVVSVSKRYAGFNLPKEDLVQEGMFGLQKAIDLFDPDLGFRFSTYSTWWIRATMHRYCRDKGRVVRIPIHMQESFERYLDMKEENGDLNDDDMADLLAVSKRKMRHLNMMGATDYFSIDAPVPSNPNICFGDSIADDRDDFKDINLDIDMSIVKDVLEDIPDRERCIIERRFGLNGFEELTLQEIAKEYRMSRERVRQIQNQAIKNLKRRIDLKQKAIRAGLINPRNRVFMDSKNERC